MKNRIYILAIGLLVIIGCSQNDQEAKEHFIESQPSFFHLRNGDWLNDEWIRKPQNLEVVHQTFKKFGYIELIGNRLNNNPFILQDLFIKKKPYNLVDSLIIAFENNNLDVKYYREFWVRRGEENNDTVVYNILKDIKYSYKSELSSAELSLNAMEDLVNDTLYQLLRIE